MKTVVALFDTLTAAERAVDALVQLGVSRDDISVVANNATGEYAVTPADLHDKDAVTAGQGATFGAIVGGLVGLGALLIPGIGPVIAAGPLAAALGAGIGAAAGAATGGITAALVKTGVPDDQAGYYAEGVRRGGTLVTVHATDANLDQVKRLLDDHGAADLNQRSSYYQSTGYSGSNGDSAPYSADQVTQEREQLAAWQGSTVAATGAGNAAMAGGTAIGAAGVAGMPAYASTIGTAYGALGANGDTDGWSRYEADFRNRYETDYANRGYTFEEYEPAFAYGYTLANDTRYHDYDWDRLEPEARRHWETEYADSPWEQFKDAVRDAWQSVRETVTDATTDDRSRNRY
jgi:hypothetical protein